MASEKLTAMKVSRARDPGLLNDGRGLYLRIAAGRTKSWVYRFMISGRAREMGLGSLDDVSLAEARDLARDARRLCKQGLDPIEARRNDRAARRVRHAKAMTFQECATAYIAAHQAGWKNKKHVKQWSQTLQDYVYPAFGFLPVQAIDVALVMKAVETIWTEKPVTAGRVRGRIESVLDWAATRGYRQGENPARWKGHLENLLPKKSKVRRVERHAALPYSEIGDFMAALRRQSGVGARALEFTILTAARTDEVREAPWDELGDLDERTWAIPAERMKADREHRVPLSDRALEIIDELRAIRQGALLFPGAKAGRPLSHGAMLRVLASMGRGNLTVHGFRSTFRDWAAERTNFPREVCEAALAHAVENKAEAAYSRGDLFAKRRQLMAAWARYCATAADGGAAVVALAAAR
jgi:integrase